MLPLLYSLEATIGDDVTYSLYYYPGNASLLPHMALREAGVSFDLRLVDRTQDAQRSA